MNIEKVGPHTWRVESRSNPGTWHEVYYKSCGGHCTCRGFRYNRWCAHLEEVEKEYEAEEIPLDEENMLYEGDF